MKQDNDDQLKYVGICIAVFLIIIMVIVIIGLIIHPI